MSRTEAARSNEKAARLLLELTSFLASFLKAGDDRTWHGVLVAKCKDIREIKLKVSAQQGLCVYDTSERPNPAHAEMFQSHFWNDNGDANEIRALLWAAFNNGIPIPPEEYYSGTILSALSSELGSSSNKSSSSRYAFPICS